MSTATNEYLFLLFSWENRLEYAKAVLDFRLQELSCEARVLAIKTGLATVVPLHVLTILNPRDLEIRVCGIPNVDIDFLKVRAFLLYLDWLKTGAQLTGSVGGGGDTSPEVRKTPTGWAIRDLAGQISSLGAAEHNRF